jgi:hypothetical protein
MSEQIEETIWLVLEEAPNYEISSDKRVRNKTTRREIKIKNDTSVVVSTNNISRSLSLNKLMNKYFPTEDDASVIWKLLNEATDYEISSEKQIRNKTSGKILKIPNTGSISLVISPKNNASFAVNMLMNKYFPIEDDPTVVWKTLDDATNYEISSNGTIRHIKNYSIVKNINNSVALYINGKSGSKSVSNLMHKYFPIEDDPSIIWKQIEEALDYEISSNKQIRNRITGKILKDSKGCLTVNEKLVKVVKIT